MGSQVEGGQNPVTGFFGAHCLSPPCQHGLGLRRGGPARGRSMRALTVRIGAHYERSKRRMAAGDSGQDPGEMVIAGVPPALVRWGKVEFENCPHGADTGEGVVMHMRDEDILGKPCFLGRPGELKKANPGLAGHSFLCFVLFSFSNFLFQMVVPALLAGGSMGSGGASLILIYEGNEERVVKRTGDLGEAALTSGDAGGSMVLKMTRMGSLSGAWTMKMRRWALLMLLGPSCLLRYPLRGQLGLMEAVPQLLSHCQLCPFSHRRVPRNLFPRSKSLISRAWRKRRRSLQKEWMKRGLRQVSP